MSSDIAVSMTVNGRQEVGDSEAALAAADACRAPATPIHDTRASAEDRGALVTVVVERCARAAVEDPGAL